MYRYTTPTIPMIVEADLSNSNIYVSFSQERTKVTKKVSTFEISNNQTTFSVSLTQLETAKFVGNRPVEIQANWIFGNGNRGATETVKIKCFDNLLDEVINYGN